MKRRLWSQIVIGWLPLWAFGTLSIVLMHPGVGVDAGASVAFRMMITAAGLGTLMFALISRYPWRSSGRAASLMAHAGLALLFSISWVGLNALLDHPVHGQRPIHFGPGIAGYVIIGFWVYSMVAGASYAASAGERAALAEAHAARAQLSALRTQLNPHFLFNALHAIVHLIPVEPARAAQAAERISDLLRTTIDEDRDLVSLGEEMTFVNRYLAMESLRFGDRLTVRLEIDPQATTLLVPSFGVHCLVENAVRHGVEGTVGPIEVVISAAVIAGALNVVVRDTGRPAREKTQLSGTGLARLRERVAVLSRSRATLAAAPHPTGGFESRLVLPIDLVDE